MTQELWYVRLKEARLRQHWSQEELAEHLQTDGGTVSRWERGEHIPDPVHQQFIKRCFPDVHFLFPQSRGKQIWTVPYTKNPFFTGREEVLQKLSTNLKQGSLTALTQAIRGLGGIGKTQTAAEYAHRHRDEYKAVLWIRATQEHYASDVASIAHVLALPEAKRQKQDQQTLLRAITRWLRNHTQWLLILDNVQEQVDVTDFFDVAGTGHVLFTTRVKAIADLAYTIELDDMTPEDGALLLLRRSHTIELEATLNAAPPADRATALKLSRIMDGLPLALDLAGAYVRETEYPLSRYEEEYHKRRGELLAWRDKQPRPYTDYTESVETTWSLSFQRVAEQNPAAIELLRFCTFLSPDAIPEDLILKSAPFLSPLLRVLYTVEDLNQTVAPLLNYSLIRRNASEKMFSIHRLIQAVIQDHISEEEQRFWAKGTVYALSDIFSVAQNGSPLDSQPYVPHVLACQKLIEQWSFADTATCHLLYVAGVYWRRRAWHTQAERFCVQALTLYEQHFGLWHPQIAKNLNNLALVYEEKREHTSAEQLFHRALDILDHTSTEEAFAAERAQVQGNLARCFFFQGNFRQAELLGKQALTTLEQIKGVDDPDAALTCTSLAIIYRDQGQHQQAEQLFQRALEIYKSQGFPEDDTYASLLAAWGKNQLCLGQFRDAKQTFQRARKVLEQTVGREHPEVALCFDCLGDAYLGMRRLKEAERCYTLSLRIYEQVMGSDYLDVAQPLCGLAVLAEMDEQYAEAETLYQRALAIVEQSQGPEHWSLLPVLENYARLLQELGRRDEARRLEERMHALSAKTYGSSLS